MNYQKLFDHMHEEHGLTLLEQEMQEIVRIVKEKLPAVKRCHSIKKDLISEHKQASFKYCPFCGEKLEPKVYTDLSSDLICKSANCGLFEVTMPKSSLKELIGHLEKKYGSDIPNVPIYKMFIEEAKKFLEKEKL